MSEFYIFVVIGESAFMRIISNISFKGIIQESPNKIGTVAQEQPLQELGEAPLPSCDKSLAINPSLPSERLGEADLARFKRVQTEWAGMIAKNLEIPVENVLARLPEVRLVDAKKMLTGSVLAAFRPDQNIIEIADVRELANAYGKDEVVIIHESTHGFFHNVRRAWAKSLAPEQLYQATTGIVFAKMLQGEHDPVLQSFEVNNVDGNITYTPVIMNPPLLSKEERVALTNTINSLQAEHIDQKAAKLNEAGKKFIQETLLPQLKDYPKHTIAEPDKVDDVILEKMTDYINALFTRKNLLLGHLIAPDVPDLEKNLQTPLTEVEQIMAKGSLIGLLSTHEGNIAHTKDSMGFFHGALKAYFMSHEELTAREEENAYRLEIVRPKIRDIEARNLTPEATLLQEQRVAENNIKLIHLVRELDAVEKQIVGADKSAEKMTELNRLKQELGICGEEHHKLNSSIFPYIDPNKIKFLVKTEEEYIRFIEESVPPELKPTCTTFFDMSKKLAILLEKLNELSPPEKLLAETPENTALKAQFDTLMQRIRTLVPECDLSSIPKQFYSSTEDFLKVNGKVIACCEKWAKILL